MPFKPLPAGSAGIITNYRCTNKCRHCLYAASPSVKDTTSTDAVRKVLNQIKDTIPDCALHIGGGEPLLEYDVLIDTLQEIKNLDLHLEYVETNGKLLTTSSGTEMIKNLKHEGLGCILLSISPFHNEFMSLNDNRIAYENIVNVFGQHGIFPWHPSYYHYLERACPEKTVPFDEYASMFSKREIEDQLTGIIYLHPGGKAAFVFADYINKYPASSFFEKNCKRECSSPVHVHIDYMGNYIAGFCAGLALGNRSGIDLENLYSRGIDTGDYPVLDAVINSNLGRLYRHAKERDFPVDEHTKTYSSPCHLCLHIRTYLYYRFPGKYRELVPEYFYKEIKEAFTPCD
jgi:hypothetical protein